MSRHHRLHPFRHPQPVAGHGPPVRSAPEGEHDTDHDGGHDASGGLIRWPRRYDLVTALAMRGRGPRVRAAIILAANLRPGTSVLDVGCGTGTLVLRMAQAVGTAGTVAGVDASPEMIGAARRRAARAAAPTLVQVAAAQALPFPDEAFGAVTSSLLLHHLPSGDRVGAVREMLRVLRPGGRLVIAEFQAPRGPLGAGTTRHALGPAMADSDLADVCDLVAAAGATGTRTMPTPVGWLGLVVAGKPAPRQHRAEPTQDLGS